jgi:hypothetical protein
VHIPIAVEPNLIASIAYSTYKARFEVFMAVTMKNAIFWVVMLCGSHKNWHFGAKNHLHRKGAKNRWTRNNISSN